jgi:hypothetical protein
MFIPALNAKVKRVEFNKGLTDENGARYDIINWMTKLKLQLRKEFALALDGNSGVFRIGD